MSIQYWLPLEDAIRRMRGLLLQPFDIGRWFVMGFTVFLVNLGSSGGGSAYNTDSGIKANLEEGDWEMVGERLSELGSNIVPAGIAAGLVLLLAAVLLVIVVILLWVSCRARFVWLENLTAGTHTLGANWTRYGAQGNSYFLWKLAFSLAGILVVAPLLFFGGVFGVLGLAGYSGPGSVAGWFLLGIAAFVVIVVMAYIDFFAESFVTVIMHRRRLGVLDAWREFRVLFDAQPGHFVLVGLVKLVLQMAAGLGLVIAGVLTCCIGLAIMAIPYLGTVLTLPVSVALRYYDLCWLGQLDGQLRLPDLATVTADAPTPDSGPTP